MLAKAATETRQDSEHLDSSMRVQVADDRKREREKEEKVKKLKEEEYSKTGIQGPEKEVVAEVPASKKKEGVKKPVIMVYGPLDQRISETFY
jgi:hypothetical protein